MPPTEYEPTIPVFELSDTMRALDNAGTGTGTDVDKEHYHAGYTITY